MPVVAPVAGSISFTDYQAKAAGYYIVEKGSDGYDYFFAHCQKGSVVVAPEQAVLAGQPLCNVGMTGDATGPHLHFEAWEGWRVDGNSPHRPAAAAEELGRQRSASRSSPVTPVSSARAQAVNADAGADELRSEWPGRSGAGGR